MNHGILVLPSKENLDTFDKLLITGGRDLEQDFEDVHALDFSKALPIADGVLIWTYSTVLAHSVATVIQMPSKQLDNMKFLNLLASRGQWSMQCTLKTWTSAHNGAAMQALSHAPRISAKVMDHYLGKTARGCMIATAPSYCLGDGLVTG
jgi:hypothetical protein